MNYLLISHTHTYIHIYIQGILKLCYLYRYYTVPLKAWSVSILIPIPAICFSLILQMQS